MLWVILFLVEDSEYLQKPRDAEASRQLSSAWRRPLSAGLISAPVKKSQTINPFTVDPVKALHFAIQV